jgi:putative hemolysin
MQDSPSKFVDVNGLIKEKNPTVHKLIPNWVIRYLSEKVIYESLLNEIMSNHQESLNFDFCRLLCEKFGIRVKIEGEENIPKNGGVIFAANHPLGGMDAIAVMSAIDNHRKDVKFLVNDLLLNIPQLRGIFVGVNKFGNTAREGIKAVDQAFAGDSALFIFPAGMVSRMTRYKVIRDLDWKKTFITKSKKYNKHVIPVHISGRLSRRFYFVARLRKFFRIKMNIEMLLLAQETIKQEGNTIVIKYGKPIDSKTFDRTKKDQDWAYDIKSKVYQLKE